jgi:hypothetical protein
MSAFRSLPATEIPATPPPDIVAQRKMIARTVDYAVKTVSSLPNFFATRETIRFENSPKGHLGRASLVPKNDVAEMSYEILAIDRILAKFGPDANELRSEFRQTVEFGLDRIWPKEASQQADLKPADRGQTLVNELESLSPKDDRQTAAQTQAASMIVALRQTQWLLFLKTEQNAVPLPLLVVLVAWLAAIFLSFGLFAAPNATTVATLALSALAVSAALFIILEMYTPFSGVLRISPAPILDALGQMGR